MDVDLRGFLTPYQYLIGCGSSYQRSNEKILYFVCHFGYIPSVTNIEMKNFASQSKSNSKPILCDNEMANCSIKSPYLFGMLRKYNEYL